MENANAQVGNDQNQVVDDSKVESVTLDAFKKVSSEAKSYRHKLNEHKEELSQLKQMLADKEQSEMEAQGQFKDLAEKNRMKVEELTMALKTKEAKYANKVVSEKFKLAVQKEGCLDPESAWKLAEHKNLVVDEDFNVDQDSLKSVIDSTKEKYNYMFQKQAPKVNDLNPTKPLTAKADIGKLSKADLLKRLADMNKG